jgi:uncharacterized membrane protein
MTKLDFLLALQEKLSGLPKDEVKERLHFYNESIEDRMEEGLSEEEAVAQIGSVDEIAQQIIGELPFTQLAKERLLPKRQLYPWEIVLLVLGSPVWLSLATAAAAVIFSVYASLWAVLISLWAVFVALAACAPGCLFAGILYLATGHALSGFAALSCALVCAGLAIFAFFGCKAATKGIWLATGKCTLWFKNRFIKKEAAQ